MAAPRCGYDYLAIRTPGRPITGAVSSHTGTDIACAEGTPILAAADGTVTVANGLDSWGGSYGYYIQIDHGGGLETLYAHCSSICVTTDQQVQAGRSSVMSATLASHRQPFALRGTCKRKQDRRNEVFRNVNCKEKHTLS